MSGQIRKHINRFLDDVIWHEPWFVNLHEQNAWDLFVLAGSHARGDAQKSSDIDLFLVLPHAAQRKHKVAAVHDYEFEGFHFEISKTTTEKLQKSTLDKRNLFWWHQTKLVRSNNTNAANWHLQAATHTIEEVKDLLWNNFCLFEIERSSNLLSCVSNKDELGVQLCTANCLRIALDSALIAHGSFVTTKHQGRLLNKLKPEAYKLFLVAATHDNMTQKIEDLDLIREYLINDLLEWGFNIFEINAWDKYNSERFLHQAL